MRTTCQGGATDALHGSSLPPRQNHCVWQRLAEQQLSLSCLTPQMAGIPNTHSEEWALVVHAVPLLLTLDPQHAWQNNAVQECAKRIQKAVCAVQAWLTLVEGCGCCGACVCAAKQAQRGGGRIPGHQAAGGRLPRLRSTPPPVCSVPHHTTHRTPSPALPIGTQITRGWFLSWGKNCLRRMAQELPGSSTTCAAWWRRAGPCGYSTA